ncbi:heavy metal transport/detoxification protein [Oxalicibacterium flavum]|uniref:Heavy metal transport/detoxification protein n=1 Tax=Oxalicibacterium flavum TaxID=179467 RepID=A0A8J2UQG4_9BURK|nr:cation transporter [Oxalicibacterium flavum]GGC12070.1 heavy metal transport/detoxification protein [Oxalicibacterium flavum]
MYTMQVENMSCGHCVNAVTKAVQAVDAQAAVNVDLAQKTVKVESGAPLDAVAAAIVDAGYPVTARAAS